MEILIFAIIALIAAVMLIKNYEKIDSALFSQNNPDYESTGRPIILYLIRITETTRLLTIW